MAAPTHVPEGRLLQVSHCSPDSTSVDIVAIHGLGTTSPLTWEARGNQACGAQRQSVNWLSDDDMLPRVVPSAKIFTFTWDSSYYQNAPVVCIRDVADTLLRKLQDQRDEENTHSRPLIFIASCFGGLIVTKALEIANTKGSEYQKLVVATSGVVFLGSPLQGTRAGTAAQWRVMLAGILSNSPSQTLIQDLDGHTKVLRDTSEQFLRTISSPPMQTMTMCFWESKKTQLAKAILPIWISKHLTSTEMILVEEDSACFFGHPKQQLDAPHVMMNKFQGPSDENFKSVSGSVMRMVGEAKRITAAQREAVNIHNEHFMVSRNVNPVFTGREEEIKNLQRSLCPSHATNLQATWPKIYVIHGLGGAGKSEVALKFVHDNRAEFWGVFWLDASSETSLSRGFTAIAEKCDLRDKSFEGARGWLQETRHSWLLVLDNADDPELDYAVYLPAATRGHVLITSRVRECADLQTAGTGCYEKLSETTAVKLLLKASKIKPSLHSTHHVDAWNIVKLLGCHALAIIQAGASISKGICDLREYEEKFKGHHERLLQFHPVQAKSRYGNVYATFEVSATYLRRRSDQAAKDALELLNFYAFLSFTEFPENTFEEAWQNSRNIPLDIQPGVEVHIKNLTCWHVRHLPNFLRQDSSEDLDKISVREARSLLVSLSIITVDSDARMTRMHPVTHMWTRDRLKKQEELTNAWLGTLAVLCLSIKDPQEQEAWWTQLQLHIESITNRIPGDYLYGSTFSFHQSFYRLAHVLHRLRADKAVIDLLQKVFIKADQSWTRLPYGHHIQHLFGICLMDYGELEEGKQWLEQAVEIRENTSGPEDPGLLSSKHELAKSYLATGESDKAKGLLEKIVKIETETLRPEHPDRLASQHELARAYLALDQNEKAKNLLEQVVKIKAETLRPDHPSRLTSQHELAGAYLALKKNKKAKDLLEKVVNITTETLRPEHPDRLTSQHELARVYLTLNKYEKAKDLLEQVVKIETETLRPKHPDCLISKDMLAQAYLATGETVKAKDQIEEVVRRREKTLGAEHPYRLASQHELARVYLALGQSEEAKDLLEKVVEIQAKTLRPEHPDRLISKRELARAYVATGEIFEAKDQIEEVVRIQAKILGSEHPHRLGSEAVLALAYLATGETVKAKDQIQEVVNVQEKLSSPENPNLLAARKMLEKCEKKLISEEIGKGLQ